MNIYKIFKDDILRLISELYKIEDDAQLVIESPKDSSHGDLSTNAALVLANKLNRPIRELAAEIKEKLQYSSYISSVEIAGPGFINCRIHNNIWQENLLDIISQNKKYGFNNIGNGAKINIEYVSANPTGPLHIGHARGAVYGDVLANLLKASGYDVTREYYINDAGSQIDILCKTALIRYKECATKQTLPIPEGYYPGAYLIPIGRKLFNQYKNELLDMPETDALGKIKQFVIDEMMEIIKADLATLDIKHDIFFSEQSLHQNKIINSVLQKLENKGLVYNGTLPPPKGKINDNWVSKPQLLFKSTEYGDDQDRPLQKNDGSWTYFAADIAYVANKITRGFNHLIMILGADHGGYTKRIEAIVQALSDGKVGIEIKLCQLVNYIENGDLIKMSKRAGSFTTVRDVANEVGKDIVRFIMLTRKNDIGLDFDLATVKMQSKDNPVFYVNYAYVRALSVYNNAISASKNAIEIFTQNKCNLSLLSSAEEIELMKFMALWPRTLEGAATHFEPHRIVFYLQNLASLFHSLWNLGKENNDYRFVIPNNAELTASRLLLATSVKYIIEAGFSVIGIEPVNKM